MCVCVCVCGGMSENMLFYFPFVNVFISCFIGNDYVNISTTISLCILYFVVVSTEGLMDD